jgi:hypothetical protein
MFIKRIGCFLIGIIFTLNLSAKDLKIDEPSHLKLNAYLEAYYLHDFNHASQKSQPDFIYNFDRSNEPNINLAFIKAAYASDKFRANFALADGTYMRANYAAEPHHLRNIYEANVGFKLSDEHKLWLDIGVLPSHIGFESAMGIQNWTLTRSVLADNSPYFETGASVSYTSQNGQWYLSGLLLNGWQRIQRADDNSTPSFGHQLTYKPNDRLVLNSSSFIGNEQSDQDRKMRYFHNFYAQYKLNSFWSVLFGLDLGAEQRVRGSQEYNIWYAPVAIVKYQMTDQLSFAARAEYYRDRDGVIVKTNANDGFTVEGYSINVDYKLSDSMTLRSELKSLNCSEALCSKANTNSAQDNVMLTSSFAVSF